MPVTISPLSLSHDADFATIQSLVASDTARLRPDIQRQLQVEVVRALKQELERKQREISAHGDRTANYAVALGATVGLSEAALLDLYFAVLLHDIGRLTLPKDLLRKQEPLTAEEYTLVQCHPRAGAELLEPIPFLRVPAILIAHHHERWDGAGYPYGLKGPFIPLGSRILAVADTFDALTSDHPYDPARDPESAMRLLQIVAGSQLDPELVEAFIELTAKLMEPLTDLLPTGDSG